MLDLILLSNNVKLGGFWTFGLLNIPTSIDSLFVEILMSSVQDFMGKLGSLLEWRAAMAGWKGCRMAVRGSLSPDPGNLSLFH
ncbi:unnamed protein product [Linum trigynum]|uniref:Uncharacterized protein n=1 Tax=Linum trigynum TaxID=586398 RepID=A0AAV2D2K5_9ROSI